MADNSKLTEEDIKRIEITPAIVAKDWDNASQIKMEYAFTKGRIMVRGKEVKKGEKKKADYLLFYKPNLPLAIVEAKSCYKTLQAGIQQGIDYATTLDVPFVYSSNGSGFYEHDRLTGQEREIALEEFPTPDELWFRYCAAKGLDNDKASKILIPYYVSDGREPRYYQRNAINKTIEAISNGQKRILLVMATGTGKTYTAFQIIERFRKFGQNKRILFLADRNILVDQTKVQDFAPFGNAMTKITNRQVDKSYEIYLSLYQAVTGTEEEKNIYKQFSPDFFDLIVVDECHRGSANEDSAWHDILEYFSSATQIGMTATPRETSDVSTRNYFGEPIYTYSLKEGIDDGFLAPYKVYRIIWDKDLAWRPELGKLDKYGNEVPDKEYVGKDYDRDLVLERRTTAVARYVMKFLRENGKYDKTIIFCENIEHADRMRAEIAKSAADLMKENPKYVMKITGDDNEGKAELDNFISVYSRYPVIAVTSRLMSTGVDAKLCKLIVLDRTVNSMTEFKQIIGRGTRVNEEYGKLYFTIMDFRGVTKHFADPAFDGDPSVVKIVKGLDIDGDPNSDESVGLPMDDTDAYPADIEWDNAEDYEPNGPKKFWVDDVEVTIAQHNIQYLDENGKLISENIKEFYKSFFLRRFPSAEDWKKSWFEARYKKDLINTLKQDGLFIKEFTSAFPSNLDIYDIVLSNTYGLPTTTRAERVKRCDEFLATLPIEQQEVYKDILAMYVSSGIDALEKREVLRVKQFADKHGSVVEIVRKMGGNEQFFNTIDHLKEIIYRD